ncbi:MAG: hypothetical protein K6T59_09160, partial [Bryobacteraceae bacterium]|nr:hypothetical protein [Bryobacteraceae bacterium]
CEGFTGVSFCVGVGLRRWRGTPEKQNPAMAARRKSRVKYGSGRLIANDNPNLVWLDRMIYPYSDSCA